MIGDKKTLIPAESAKRGLIIAQPDEGRPFMEHTGCFAPGTAISLANGQSKPIEELVTAIESYPADGDILLSVDGRRQNVLALVTGIQPQRWPIMKIEARGKTNGADIIHSISITRNHSMVRGLTHLMHANLLRPGDRIQSIYGESTVMSIDLLPTEETQVWSLYLASDEFVAHCLPYYHTNLESLCNVLYRGYRNSLLGLAPKQHLVFSNGFLTGDYCLQNQLDELMRAGYNLNSFV